MKVKDLFTLRKGHDLELMHMGVSSGTGINFVSRTAQNNGVAAQVEKTVEPTPFPAGCISVALGGSVLSAFVQTQPFYTAFHITVLQPKTEMTLAEKLYYCLCITANAYRYSYGRQANKTLKDIELPDAVPDWARNASVEPIKTAIKPRAAALRPVQQWKAFPLRDLFDISVSADKNLFDSDGGATPYVASSAENNGVTGFVDNAPSQKAHTLTLARNGSVGTVFYQPFPYCASPDDIRVLTPRFPMDAYVGLFIKTILEREKFKYGYGRKLGTKRVKGLVIKLPAAADGTPDWAYMARYIKLLPYSDRIVGIG